jgi:hypothetical protein
MAQRISNRDARDPRRRCKFSVIEHALGKSLHNVSTRNIAGQRKYTDNCNRCRRDLQENLPYCLALRCLSRSDLGAIGLVRS